MTHSEKDNYQVAVKAFLERDGAFLILKDRYGDWDIPGGRLLPGEFETPLTEVLRRKLREELGDRLAYAIGEPIVHMRHQRTEPRGVVRIFAVGYLARRVSGEIELSPQHTEAQWAPIDTFDPEPLFQGGWLQGVRDYLSIRRAAKP